MTVVVIMGAMEWVVLRLEIPVFWVMEDGGMRLVWVCNRLEREWVEVVAVMADVPVLKGASVMVSDGWVSGVMDEVTMLVVEGMTENGVIGADVASVLGLMSTHGVRGELGTMVTVMVSGQGVVEGREI